MKAGNREKLRVVQGVLGALAGVFHDEIGTKAAIVSAAENIMEVLKDEEAKESEAGQ